MPRPVLKLKPKRPEGTVDCPKCDGWLKYDIAKDLDACVKCDHTQPLAEVEVTEAPSKYPKDWVKGQLLNLRKAGDGYVLTVLGEEYDSQHPERALFFDNSYACQEFVSAWYNRDSHDPRAV